MTPPDPLPACSRCDTPLEHGDLRCSICAEAAPAQARSQDVEALTILRCDGCGAAMTYDASHQAPLCGFCGSVTHLETIEDPVEQTSHYLPFSVQRDRAREALGAWLGSLGFFRPGDLTTASRIEELHPLWWTCWVFDARALVSWTADSDANSHRSAWAPHAGQVDMVFEDVHVSASRGLTLEETDFLANSYDFASGRIEPAGLDVHDEPIIEQFDVQRSAARRLILDAIHRGAGGTVAAHHVPGSTTRNVNVEVLLRALETSRLAAPAWVLAYRYDGTLYRVVISGQEASAIRGAAPYSWWRILGVVAASALALALVIMLIIALAG